MALGCCAVPYEDMLAFAAMMALAPACCVASSPPPDLKDRKAHCRIQRESKAIPSQSIELT